MTSVKLKLNKDRIRRDGTYPLVFQLIHQRRKKLIYTPFKLHEDEFDEEHGKVLCVPNGLRPPREIRRMNREIARQRRSIDGHIETLESRRESYTVADVVFRYQVEHDSLSLLHYIDLQIKQRERSGRFGSVAALRSTRASVAAFLGSKIAVLADVNGTFVRDYEAWLLRRGVCPNTVCYYMRNLKSVYNQAMLDGYPVCCNNPFRFVYVRPQRTVKRALDRDAMRRIADIDLSAYPHLEQARDLFMFSFFSRGMPFVDMVFLQKSAVSGGVISYRRHKTNQWLHVEVTPQLKTLMEKYANDSPWVFPLLEGTGDKLAQYKHYRLALERVNRNLKRVAQKCNLDTVLTAYVARHSWATLARESGAPVAVISEGLGHTSEKTTQIYLKEFDRQIVDRVNRIVSSLCILHQGSAARICGQKNLLKSPILLYLYIITLLSIEHYAFLLLIISTSSEFCDKNKKLCSDFGCKKMIFDC